MAAATHELAVEGLEEKTKELLEEAGVSSLPTSAANAKLLIPPTPIMRVHGNWPLLTVSKGMLNLEEQGKFGVEEPEEGAPSSGGGWDEGETVEAGEGWGDNEIDTEESGQPSDEPSAGGGGWDFEDDMNMPELDKVEISKHGKDTFWTPPNPGQSFKQAWCSNSNLAADHIAAGSFESAMQLLNQQVGAVNFAPLKPYFIQLMVGSRVALPCTPSVPSVIEGVQRSGAISSKRNTGLPMLFTGLPALVERLKNGYRLTTEGKFLDALTDFLAIIHNLLLIVVDNKQEATEAQELLALCREYVTGIRLELQRKELSTSKTDTSIRQAELAAYFTHCNLQPRHLILSLRSAMNCAYKIKNYNHAASFAKRLLELNPPSADFITQARKVVKFAEQNPNNEVQIAYDERNPFVVCCVSFSPIYRGSPVSRCPYCSSACKPEHNGKLCPICQIAKLGQEAPGLTVRHLFHCPLLLTTYRCSLEDKDVIAAQCNLYLLNLITYLWFY